MSERASPLAAHLAAGAQAGTTPAGVTFAELRPAAFFELLDMPGTPAATRTRALDALAPGAGGLAIGATVVHGGLTVGRLAPRRIIAIGAQPTPDTLTGLAAAFGVVDDSHGRAGVRLVGAAADVLAKGLALDLDERAFPIGRMTQVRGFGLGLTLVRRASDTFDVHCAASFAASLVDGLKDAALEVGWRADPAIV